MPGAGREAGSFRDRSGHVYRHDGTIYRSVRAGKALEAYQAAKQADIWTELVEKGWLVGLEEVSPPEELASADAAALWLKHPTLDHVSFPYEWPFSLWKKAALHHLKLHLYLLGKDFTLSDATAYNIQFDGTKPLFIDHLSVIPYEDGAPWIAHHQFCEQFLNPLLMWAKCEVAPNHWMRGALEGIAPEDLLKLLPLKSQMSPTVIGHVRGLAMIKKARMKAEGGEGEAAAARLPKTRLIAMLEGLRSAIKGLSGPGDATVWSDYAEKNSYSEPEADEKRGFVEKMVAASPCDLMIDMGCNTGDYSVAGLSAGAKRVIGFDFDFGALERAVARSDKGELNFTPLWLDAANPSPSQGWAERERSGFSARAKADAVVALAFVHHLAIARNVPLAELVDWIIDIAPRGVIEFPSKQDAMVRRLLETREDIFDDYTETDFRDAILARGRIVDELSLMDGRRLLIHYARD